jgi:1-acyl-sn-glycerol-3-phosphate acyltransferase
MILSLIKIFLCGVYTAIFTILSLIIIPINYKGKIFYSFTKPWAMGILFIIGVRIKVTGKENIKKGQNYIFVSNHSSMVDIPVVMRGIPIDSRLVAKRELSKIPFFGFVLKYCGYIVIDRERSIQAMRSIEEAVKKIKDGISVTLFAEGTRSKDGSIQPFKRGAFLLASKSGIPIIPVTIKGSSNILPKKKLRIQSGKIELIFGEPVTTSHIMNKQDELSLMDNVRNMIVKNYSN